MRFLTTILLSTILFLTCSTSLAVVYAQNPVGISVPTTISGAYTVVQDNEKYSALIRVISTTIASGSFTCSEITNLCTKGAHDMGTGLPVTLTTTGALPTNVSTGTNYYVIKVSDTTFQFAASLANALAGTAIVLTSSGSGTQTVNPNSFVSASAKLQGSMDGTNWADLPISATGDATKTNTITGVGNFVFYSDIPMNYFRPYYTMTAGGQLHVEQVTKVYPRK